MFKLEHCPFYLAQLFQLSRKRKRLKTNYWPKEEGEWVSTSVGCCEMILTQLGSVHAFMGQVFPAEALSHLQSTVSPAILPKEWSVWQRQRLLFGWIMTAELFNEVCLIQTSNCCRAGVMGSVKGTRWALLGVLWHAWVLWRGLKSNQLWAHHFSPLFLPFLCFSAPFPPFLLCLRMDASSFIFALDLKPVWEMWV